MHVLIASSIAFFCLGFYLFVAGVKMLGAKAEIREQIRQDREKNIYTLGCTRWFTFVGLVSGPCFMAASVLVWVNWQVAVWLLAVPPMILVITLLLMYTGAYWRRQG